MFQVSCQLFLLQISQEKCSELDCFNGQIFGVSLSLTPVQSYLWLQTHPMEELRISLV